jgi:Phosphodiester glycosidase
MLSLESEKVSGIIKICKMKLGFVFIFTFVLSTISKAQLKWENVDNLFGQLPKSIHVFKSNDSLDGKPSIAYYVDVDLKDKKIEVDTDTTYKRRLTPQAFYQKNNKPYIIVNGTFFSFQTQQNLNAMIKNGKLVAYNTLSIPLRGKDTGSYFKFTRSAIGISKKRNADVAWLFTDSLMRFATAFEDEPVSWKDQIPENRKSDFIAHSKGEYHNWKMKTAIGGGPTLLHNGEINITNDLERMFSGKGKFDLHPRTAMGYTNENHLIILAVEGRNIGIAEGASLVHLATIFKTLGCVEALNLDGGGSSCLLINGKETIKPSDKEGERPVPGVFLVK